MGASGSGKTSMRSLILYVPFACSLTRMPMNPLHSSNNPASLTSRLGATIDVEQNHVRFLGDLILNLWDCGGQDAFMDSYLSTQRLTTFQHVGVLIYGFEVSAHDAAKDAAYYRDCLDALQKYSPDAAVFLLVHKMILAAHASCRRRVEPCPSRCSVRASTTRRCTRYAIRRRCLTHISHFRPPSPPLTPSTPRVWTDERRHGRESCTPPSPTRPSCPST